MTGPVGPNPSAGLNAAIPYEPWNLNVALNTYQLPHNEVHYVQFIAPSTAQYTEMTIFSGDTPFFQAQYLGRHLFTIFREQVLVPEHPDMLIGQGIRSTTPGSSYFSSHQYRKHIYQL